MYAEIASNKRKTVGLIVLFTVVIMALGWTLGASLDSARTGIIGAAILSTVMVLVGYFKGDAVALSVSGAKPLERSQNPELYNVVENLAITAGLPTPAIYVIPDPSANAFATGRDPKHASLAVTTGLLQTMDRSELEGVLAHELSHVGNYDIRVMTIVVVLVGVILLLSDWILRSAFYRRRGRDENGQAAAILLIVGLVLAILSPLFAELIKLAVSRQREYLADASGSLLTRYPEGLAKALEKIAAMDQPLHNANHATAHLFLANPFDPHVTKRFEQLFSTHPPIEERIKRLRTMGV